MEDVVKGIPNTGESMCKGPVEGGGWRVEDGGWRVEEGRVGKMKTNMGGKTEGRGGRVRKEPCGRRVEPRGSSQSGLPSEFKTLPNNPMRHKTPPNKTKSKRGLGM